ncbi:hypothetical protein UlMin_003441 [Ulmus minor]
MWVVDHMGVSRSRSLSSFRNDGWFGLENDRDLMVFGVRNSISGDRSSSVTACMVLDSGRRSGFSEIEPRRSGFGFNEGLGSESSFDYKDVMKIGLVEFNNNGVNGGTRRVFSLRESDFSGMDESSFIDLNLDYYTESKLELSSKSAFGSMRGSSEYSRAKECGTFYGASFPFVLISFTSI